MRRIYNETEIAAPVERVWKLLSEFESYPEWNPFIIEAKGKLRSGGDLALRVRLPGHDPMKLHCRIIALWEPYELKWVGSVTAGSLLRLEHGHELQPLGPDRTKYVQWEEFTGPLVSFVRGQLDAVEAGHKLMNAALKRVAEEGPAQRQPAPVQSPA